ncbi:hypothetical protein NT6N_16850 [Oceaniferula spumae]|uniref:Ice-binding protein C-terminal domain-containing protein n=1 Tax=Oceaniferula spumae TaxID=2979115 RepID=A0AAT9FL00_9BACT
MKYTKYTLNLAGAAVIAAAGFSSVEAATIISLPLGVQGRAIDNAPSGSPTGDGSGDAFNGGAAQAGAYGSGVDLVAVFSFQMTGLNPADILSADFITTQDNTNFSDGTTFDLTANIVRASSTSTGLASDFQTVDTVLMNNFENGHVAGSVSLDPSGENTLANWLQTNWVEDDWVFISLSTGVNMEPGGTNNLHNYSGSQLLVDTVPEPSSTALLGLGGIALLMRRRK